MNEKAPRKLLLLGYLCVAVAVAVVASLYGSYRVQNLYVEQTSDDLEVRGRLCIPQLLALLEQDDTQGVDDLCKELGKAVDMRITVILPTGKVVGDTEEDPQVMENHSDRPEIRQALKDSSGVGGSTRYSTTIEKTLMYVAVATPKGRSPVMVVRTSIPITTVDDRLESVGQSFFMVGVLTVLLIVIAIPWFSIRFTYPVENAARNRGQRDAETPRQESPDEESV